MPDPGLVARVRAFHPWDAMSPAALSGILERGPFTRTAETGCGGSTIVLSQASQHHTVFAIEGENRTITELRNQPDLDSSRVVFVEGLTKDTVPRHQFDAPLDLVLLDGPHAYPLPQLEFVYLFPHLKLGGWLVIDDIQIPSVHELFTFLRAEPSFTLESVELRTAFFRRIQSTEPGPDDWPEQGINRHTILRYSWRERVLKMIGRLHHRVSLEAGEPGAASGSPTY